MVIGILASQGIAFLWGRWMGADFTIKEFEKRGDVLLSEPGDLVYDLWVLVNATSMWPGRRREFHRGLDALRKKIPLANPERSE
jgi:hypothetical protein